MISVVVPIYKIEKYIKRCVDSILAQDYKDIEIILVDDGSPDNCPEICNEYAAKDSRVKVIHKKNGGLISARKAGLAAASGEYACFVDGDDYIEPDMYEHIADAIKETGADCVITQFFYSYPDREQPSEYLLNKPFYSREEIEKEIFPVMLFTPPFYSFGIYPNCWTKVFRTEILKRHLNDVDNRIRLGEDAAFTYACIMECGSLAFVDKPLYHYRVNPESMTKAYDAKLPEIYLLPYIALKNKSEELGVDLEKQLPYYLLYLVNFVVRNEANAANPKSKAEKNTVLDAVLNEPYVADSVGKIESSVLPKHTQLLLLCLKKKSRFMLLNYMKLLRGFM